MTPSSTPSEKLCLFFPERRNHDCIRWLSSGAGRARIYERRHGWHRSSIQRVNVYRCSSPAFLGAGLHAAARWFRSGWGCITLQSAKLCASEVFIGAEIAVSSRATPVERSFHDASSMADGGEGRKTRPRDLRDLDRWIIFPTRGKFNYHPRGGARLSTVDPLGVGRGVNNGAVVVRHEWEFVDEDDSIRSISVCLERSSINGIEVY